MHRLSFKSTPICALIYIYVCLFIYMCDYLYIYIYIYVYLYILKVFTTIIIILHFTHCGAKWSQSLILTL